MIKGIKLVTIVEYFNCAYRLIRQNFYRKTLWNFVSTVQRHECGEAIFIYWSALKINILNVR